MILSPEGQIENSGRARQRGQTGQIGGTSHCRWTGHKQDITSQLERSRFQKETRERTCKTGEMGGTDNTKLNRGDN